jgi:hypothetical protein
MGKANVIYCPDDELVPYLAFVFREIERLEARLAEEIPDLCHADRVGQIWRSPAVFGWEYRGMDSDFERSKSSVVFEVTNGVNGSIINIAKLWQGERYE